MTTKKLLEIIKKGELNLKTIKETDLGEVLAKFIQTRQVLFDIYSVRSAMFENDNFRQNSDDKSVYEGLNEVVNKLYHSISENILFIEVKTDDGDEISLFFQEDDNLFLGYIYVSP
ncbi:MAG: hypothetical protein U5N85_07430 [Arcicella sp.]|nr:hypothetical protein [Arcicella sp.]